MRGLWAVLLMLPGSVRVLGPSVCSCPSVARKQSNSETLPLSTFPELHSKERRPEGDSRFLRRFSGVLASGTLAGVGGGRSAESAAALSSRVYSYIYSRVRVSVEPVMAASAFVLLSAIEGG